MDTYPSQSRAEAFLQLYRALETALDERYAVDPSASRQNSVARFLSDPDSKPLRSELASCRTIRNILSHEIDDNGEPPVEPSAAMLGKLERILNYVLQPKRAIDYGTPCPGILSATPDDPLIDMMHRMGRLGYSHLPILDTGHVVGVLSPAALFEHLEKNGLESLGDCARIRDLKNVLSLNSGQHPRYLFLPAHTTLEQARSVFEEHLRQKHRLGVIFITQTGAQTEPLLAMLTHWDVLKEPPDD